jgi:anti-anti-sigma factor
MKTVGSRWSRHLEDEPEGPMVIDFRPDAFAANEAAAVSAVKSGWPAVFDLDSREALETADVRLLIKLLRRCRDLGGELTLRTSKPQHRQTLRATGLDRVFPVAFSERA